MLEPVARSQDLPELLAGFCTSIIPAVTVNGVTADSRDIASGDLFLATCGRCSHGLDHAERAICAGARAIAWERAGDREATDLSVPNVDVPALSERIGEIAAKFHDYPADRLFLVGVTGTDGKTSCAWLIARALSALDNDCGYLGTLGYGDLNDLAEARHTTPEATRLQYWLARMVASDYAAAALEVSSHALDQRRTDALAFDVAVLTQIGRDHLDYHGDEKTYIAAKRRLFDRPGLRDVVINADDATGRRWLAENEFSARPIAYGQSKATRECDRFVYLARIVATGDGLSLDIDTHRGTAYLSSPLVGLFNAFNLAAALAVLLAREIGLNEAVDALSRVPAVPGRMERVDAGRGQPLVVVDYAHTPGALEAALPALAEHAGGRLFCVFGCGGDRDRGKRALMGEIAARYADRFWITDDNPRGEDPGTIVTDIIDGIPAAVTAASRYEIVHAREHAIGQAIGEAGPDDVVLIAGKGHETTQEYGDRRLDFDDRVVARRVLEAL